MVVTSQGATHNRTQAPIGHTVPCSRPKQLHVLRTEMHTPRKLFHWAPPTIKSTLRKGGHTHKGNTGVDHQIFPTQDFLSDEWGHSKISPIKERV